MKSFASPEPEQQPNSDRSPWMIRRCGNRISRAQKRFWTGNRGSVSKKESKRPSSISGDRWLRHVERLNRRKDFAGARCFSAENSHMIKRALLVVLGFFSLCFPLAAQQTMDAGSPFALYRPEIFSTVDGSVLLQSLPVLTLLNGQRLPVSTELGRMGRAPLNLFPDASLRVAEVQRINAAPIYRTDGKASPDEVMSSSLNPTYFGGEVGFLYGHSSGKFGGDVMQTYIVGEVGNDIFQITAGASYEESSVRVPRFRSFAPLR